jgi:hypothetical protein
MKMMTHPVCFTLALLLLASITLIRAPPTEFWWAYCVLQEVSCDSDMTWDRKKCMAGSVQHECSAQSAHTYFYRQETVMKVLWEC